MVWARYQGLAAAVEAAAWTDAKDALFLSLVGPREAVRGILSALASGRRAALALPEGRLDLEGGGGSRIRVVRLKGGQYHGVYHRTTLGKLYYVAREEDPRREALWASRSLGYPIPPAWWPRLRPLLLQPALNAVVLRSPSRMEYERLVEEMTGKAA